MFILSPAKKIVSLQAQASGKKDRMFI